MTGLPFRPGDWAVDSSDRVARVKSVYAMDGDILLDLSIYAHSGDRIGRQSPAVGGPRSYEPACNAKYWSRIKRPDFPITLQWVNDGKGNKVARYYAGPTLPPADWTPPVRKPKAKPVPPKIDMPDHFTKAELRHLETLFVDANDPVSLAIGIKAKNIADWFEGKWKR